MLNRGLLRTVLCLILSSPVIAQVASKSDACLVLAQSNETPSELIVRLQLHEVECKKNVNFLFALGQILNSQQRYDEAVDRLESLLMQQPEHWPAQLEYAIALDGSGDRASADALLAQLQDEPNLPPELLTTISARRLRWQMPATPLLLSRQSIALIGGYDNNLLGSTRTGQLDLTLPNGTLPVTIDPRSQPRAGNFGRIDWRGDLRLVRTDGSYWNLALAANVRHAPGNSDTDYNLFGMNLERVGQNQQGPYLLLAFQNLNAQTGDIYRLAGLSGGMDLSDPNIACSLRMGVEGQYRVFPEVDLYNGIYGGVLAQGRCPLSGWHTRLRYGQDRAEYQSRPGGDQKRGSWLIGKQTTLDTHRLNLEVDLEYQVDKEGFSPLLENNLRRKINKAVYRIEYTKTGAPIEPIAGIEWLKQESNLALYDISTRILYLGLRLTW